MNIAIIGGGIFGCTAALRLARDGHRVTLLESAADVILGATFTSSGRVHLGYHYPRDSATAKQSARGFRRFCQTFSAAVRDDFPNAYFIAKEGSRTTPEAFLKFCAEHNLPADPIDLDMVAAYIRGVSLGVYSKEAVCDADALRDVLSWRLSAAYVTVWSNASVRRIYHGASGGYDISLAHGARTRFDAIVNATYAAQNELTAQLGHQVQPRQYEHTAVAIIRAPWSAAAGITIMDGPFATILPYGKSNYHMLYHVEDSVIARSEEPVANVEILNGPRLNESEWFEKLRGRCAMFVPALARAQLVRVLHGPRVVLAAQDATDARPSIITAHEPRYITVFAGKIDHCLDAADEVAILLARS